jgi:hypothetical protein
MSIKVLDVRSREQDKSTNKTRISIFLTGETMIENLMNRFSRESTMYRKEVLPTAFEMLKTVDPELYKQIKDDKWKWSQYAGCSCGCSPGFVGSTKTGKQIFIDIKEKK